MAKSSPKKCKATYAVGLVNHLQWCLGFAKLKRKKKEKKKYLFDISYVCFIDTPLKYVCGYLVINDSIMRILQEI